MNEYAIPQELKQKQRRRRRRRRRRRGTEKCRNHVFLFTQSCLFLSIVAVAVIQQSDCASTTTTTRDHRDRRGLRDVRSPPPIATSSFRSALNEQEVGERVEDLTLVVRPVHILYNSSFIYSSSNDNTDPSSPPPTTDDEIEFEVEMEDGSYIRMEGLDEKSRSDLCQHTSDCRHAAMINIKEGFITRKRLFVNNMVMISSDSHKAQSFIRRRQHYDSRWNKKNIGRLLTGGVKRQGISTVLVIKIDAEDSVFPISSSELSRRVFGGFDDKVNVVAQYKACSYDKLQLIKAPNPYNIKNMEDGVLSIKVDVLVDGNTASSLVNEAVFQAEDMLGGSLEDAADHVMFCVPPGTGSWFAFAHINWYRSVYNGLACTYVSAQMHEIGHNLGLGHSGVEKEAYGDSVGYMSYGVREHEAPKRCFNGAMSWKLGWYADKTKTREYGNEEMIVTMVGVTHYRDSDPTDIVVLHVETAVEDDLFVQYNRVTGINSGSLQAVNRVAIVKGTSASTRLAILDSQEEFTHAGVTIRVCFIGLDLKSAIVSVRDQGTAHTCEYSASTTSLIQLTPQPTASSIVPPIPLPPPLSSLPTPTMTNQPSIKSPTEAPTEAPTDFPTSEPSESPTLTPTSTPSSLPTEILPAEDPPSNLICAYNFDGNANDSKEHSITAAAVTNENNLGIDGTMYGTPRFESDGISNFIDFDQDDEHQFVTIGPTSTLEFGATVDFTVSLWTKTDDVSIDAAIISNKDWQSVQGKGWVIAASEDGQWQWNIGDGINYEHYFEETGQIDDGNWHHILVTHSRAASANVATLYFDGMKIIGIDTSSIRDITSGFPTVIGSDGVLGKNYPAFYKGCIDGVSIYNTALSPSEVRSLHHAGRARIPGTGRTNLVLSTLRPTIQSDSPTSTPSINPTSKPSTQPSANPTSKPSTQPSANPTSKPSTEPSENPTSKPSYSPSQSKLPSSTPTTLPTDYPTNNPSQYPSTQPTTSFSPSTSPTISTKPTQSSIPTSPITLTPTATPISTPSMLPSITSLPTLTPSSQPSTSQMPSRQPVQAGRFPYHTSNALDDNIFNHVYVENGLSGVVEVKNDNGS